MLEQPAHFAWETHEYLKMSDEGNDIFCSLIRGQDWTMVKEKSNVNKMTAAFHIVISRAVSNGKEYIESQILHRG